MAWLSNWTYRKSIVIAHTDDGAQTNYQIKLLVGESPGATGEQVDCNSHVASDFDDLRFTTSDGTTLCDYWIESLSGSTPNQLATVWIEVPSIAAHPDDTTIYMYYGGTQTAVSSGINTFGVNKWDNFEWGNNGDHIHTAGGNVTWTSNDTSVISTEQEYTGIASDTRSMKLLGGSTRPLASFVKANGTNYAIRFWNYKETATNTKDAGLMYHSDGTKTIYIGIDAAEDVYYFDGAWKDTTLNASADAWDLIEVNAINWTAGTFTVVVNGTAATGLGMYVGAVGTDAITFRGDSVSGQDVWVDNPLVRQFTANEPAFSSAGAEIAAIITGTIVPTATEAEIVTGGKTIIITLTGDTWVATVGEDNAITTALIAGIDSAQAEATGWDAVVKANMVYTDVVRTSDTVVTITLGDEATYDITANETITITIPATALTGGAEVEATPTFQVTAAGGEATYGFFQIL